MADRRSGIERHDWTPAFPGQRPPFAVGNDFAVKHGGYVSGLKLQGRAAEIFEALKPHVPGYCGAFAPMLTICATLLARSEVALAAIAKLDEVAISPLTPYTIEDAAKLGRLREDVRGWLNSARRTLNDLGCSPVAAAKLGLDVALARRASEAALSDLVEEGRSIRAARGQG